MGVTFQTARRKRLGVPDGIPLCSRCDQPHDRKGQRLCRDCHNAYQRDWKAEQARMAREFRRTFHMKRVTGET